MNQTRSTMAIAIAVGCAILAGLNASARAAEADIDGALSPPKTTMRRTPNPIVIDGRLDEEAWQSAELLPILFFPGGVDTAGSPGGFGRLTFDGDNLYVAFDVVDRDVLATGTERDKGCIMPPNDVIEVFIDVNGDDEFMFEFHVNPLNALNDLIVLRPRPGSPLKERAMYGFIFLSDWNPPDIETAARVKGEVNDSEDEDEGWTVEMRLPYSSLMMPIKRPKPLPGDVWRMQLVIQDGASPRRYLCWSPSRPSWFHDGIADWGRVTFGE